MRTQKKTEPQMGFEPTNLRKIPSFHYKGSISNC